MRKKQADPTSLSCLLSFLVFHGGSGSTKEEITTAVKNGCVKMNIDTDCTSRSASLLFRLQLANGVSVAGQWAYMVGMSLFPLVTVSHM
jgi:fructose/tagatose bisphosphate aldolase